MQPEPMPLEEMSRTPVAFPLPSFLLGLAMSLDLGATLRIRSYREFLEWDAEEANATALALDWFVIGEDARSAVEKLDRELAAP